MFRETPPTLTTRLGFGLDLGVGLEPDGGVLGGVSQDAPGAVIASALGQAGFLAATCAAARATTGRPVLRIESPARSGPACFPACVVAACCRGRGLTDGGQHLLGSVRTGAVRGADGRCL